MTRNQKEKWKVILENFTVHHNVGGIKGLCVIEPRILVEEERYQIETYNKQEFFKHGLLSCFVQDNEVHNLKGTLRGLHLNCNHPQSKLIRVLHGNIFDVTIDLRKNSDTYKRWYGIELSEKNRKQLYIPKGFGHGYLALSESDVLFKVSSHYIPGDEIGFAWNSREFCIQWPEINTKYIMNVSDAANPDFSTLNL